MAAHEEKYERVVSFREKIQASLGPTRAASSAISVSRRLRADSLRPSQFVGEIRAGGAGSLPPVPKTLDRKLSGHAETIGEGLVRAAAFFPLSTSFVAEWIL
jgi:hypothetical protein